MDAKEEENTWCESFSFFFLLVEGRFTKLGTIENTYVCDDDAAVVQVKLPLLDSGRPEAQQDEDGGDDGERNDPPQKLPSSRTSNHFFIYLFFFLPVRSKAVGNTYMSRPTFGQNKVHPGGGGLGREKDKSQKPPQVVQTTRVR